MTVGIVQSGVFQSGAAGSTAAVTLGAAITAGNKLIAFIGTETTTTWSATGWSELFHVDSATSNARLYCFTRTADGTEGATVTFTGSASHNRTVTLYELTADADLAGIVYATAPVSYPGSGATFTTPAVTAPANGSLAIAVTTANAMFSGDTFNAPFTRDFYANSNAHDQIVGHEATVAAGTSVSATEVGGGTGWGADGLTATVVVSPVAFGGTASLTLSAAGGGQASDSATASLTLSGAVSLSQPASATASLTLSATGGGTASSGGAASLELTAGAPSGGVRPVYKALFTVEVTGDAGGIPLPPVEAPTSDYGGDDDSDLVDYPDPDLDEWGRPIAS